MAAISASVAAQRIVTAMEHREAGYISPIPSSTRSGSKVLAFLISHRGIKYASFNPNRCPANHRFGCDRVEPGLPAGPSENCICQFPGLSHNLNANRKPAYFDEAIKSG